mmetsp:Transcript_57716/g.133301  ORF Transcript_57716/g.133301 Transcript_57716/m.133301 type:complete len:236 (+) Transcript_57716:779-1486(+)
MRNRSPPQAVIVLAKQPDTRHTIGVNGAKPPPVLLTQVRTAVLAPQRHLMLKLIARQWVSPLLNAGTATVKVNVVLKMLQSPLRSSNSPKIDTIDVLREIHWRIPSPARVPKLLACVADGRRLQNGHAALTRSARSQVSRRCGGQGRYLPRLLHTARELATAGAALLHPSLRIARHITVSIHSEHISAKPLDGFLQHAVILKEFIRSMVAARLTIRHLLKVAQARVMVCTPPWIK